MTRFSATSSAAAACAVLLATAAVVHGQSYYRYNAPISATGCYPNVDIDPWIPSQGANGRFAPLNLCCGGNLTFVWTGSHNVWSLPSADDFQACDRSSGSVVAPTANGGAFTVTPRQNRVFWYACFVNNHCSTGGQRVAVNVTGC